MDTSTPAYAAPTLATRRFDHPDVRLLNDLVQAEYRERYNGDGDATPLDPGMFDPPRGLFLVAYDADGRPVGSGGWRARDGEGARAEGYADGDAEIKRMFVVGDARGRGLSRLILARIEETARAAGRTRMVLETGTAQPEAMALYASSGYELVPEERKFGLYRCSPSSRCYVKLF
jgi:GNAT superfamily N-acetyltransferase